MRLAYLHGDSIWSITSGRTTSLLGALIKKNGQVHIQNQTPCQVRHMVSVLPPRKVPFTLQNAIGRELDPLDREGFVEKVVESNE